MEKNTIVCSREEAYILDSYFRKLFVDEAEELDAFWMIGSGFQSRNHYRNYVLSSPYTGKSKQEATIAPGFTTLQEELDSLAKNMTIFGAGLGEFDSYMFSSWNCPESEALISKIEQCQGKIGRATNSWHVTLSITSMKDSMTSCKQRPLFWPLSITLP